jgi:hypothetical protein
MENRGRVSSEEEQAFLPKAGITNNDTERQEINGDHKMGAVSPPRRGWISWLRLLLELGMALTIAYMIIFKPFVVTRDERLLRTPVPQCEFHLPGNGMSKANLSHQFHASFTPLNQMTAMPRQTCGSMSHLLFKNFTTGSS